MANRAIDCVQVPHTNDWRIDKKYIYNSIEMTPTNSRKIDLFRNYRAVPIQNVTKLGRSLDHILRSLSSLRLIYFCDQDNVALKQTFLK